MGPKVSVLLLFTQPPGTMDGSDPGQTPVRMDMPVEQGAYNGDV
jgi:hypothetical protein